MERIILEDIGAVEAAKKAALVLKIGGIVLYPTDTIYGLGVDATNKKAVALLKAIKGRETKKPISILVRDVDAISAYGVLSNKARALAEKYMPGPLTLVLPATTLVPEEVSLHGTIGVRIPDNELCIAMTRAFNAPITATSANKSGMQSAETVREILEQFSYHVKDIALVIDGGKRKSEKSSTVVSCVGEKVFVLREGVITKAELGL